MTSKKQKEKKKKEREKIAKSRILRRREALRKERKELNMEQQQEKQAEQSAYGKPQPFIKNDSSDLNNILQENKDASKEGLKEKLEHNLKILEALEQEYEAETSQRKEINQKLENEGFMTMKEKMDALHRKALEIEGKATDLDAAQKEFDQVELEQAQKDYKDIVDALSCEKEIDNISNEQDVTIVDQSN